MSVLVNTEQASRKTGLSTYELRLGWKEGRYPALVIGSHDQRKRLRWNLDLLEEAIKSRMNEGGK